MLSAADLKIIFEKKYERNVWYSVLRQNFNVGTLSEKPVDITPRIKSNDYKATARELGNFNTTDGHLVGLYEVEVPEKAQIHRNRKGLRNLLSQVYSNDVEAALLVFIQGNKWRFSYVSEISIKNKATGKREKKSTDAKRFTYLMGEGERCKTASERFVRIQKTDDLFGGGITLDALEDAFNVDKMSKAFFNEYRKQYGYFTAHLTGEDENGKKIRNASPFLKSTFNGDHKAARDFVKKMMGRIVFLYFLEKKGWLGVPNDKKWGAGDENFLRNLFNDSKDKKAFYSNVLVPLFFATLNTERKEDAFKIDDKLFTKPGYSKLKIPYLNGGLFEEDETKQQFLVFPEELFASLFTFFDQYNFTVYEDSPDEHTVAVDPEMLGHIFENLLEDNKTNGTFYTPKEIVHYMCRESLIEYLYTKLNPGDKINFKELVSREAIERFVLQHEAGDIINYEEEILKALKDVKICDPAIGSGAFPMGLLMEIYYLVETMFNISKDVVNRVWKLGNSDIFNAAKVKEQIIQNSIYGVDIEKGAVDIARLRFWLSLVVDEETPKPLPNLDYKIVVGNSLLSMYEDEVIDIDWNINMAKAVGKTKDLIKEQELKLYDLQHKQHLYFKQPAVDKKKLQNEIKNIKIDVLVNQLTLSRMSSQERNPILGGFAPTSKEIQRNLENAHILKSYEKNIEKLLFVKKDKNKLLRFFDWKLDFPEVMNEKVVKSKVGFDIVIGNPPYVSSKGFDKSLINFIVEKYETSQYQLDLYIAFIERSVKIARSNGVITLITPNSWLKNMMFSKCRQFLLNNVSVLSILPNLENVFEAASVDSLIFVSRKQFGDSKVQVYKFEKSILVLKHIVQQSRFASNERFVFDVETDDSFYSIIEKVRKNSFLLTDVSEISRGVNPYDKARGQSDEIIKGKLYHANFKKDKTFIPELRGKHVSSYCYNWDGKHYISYGTWLAAPREPKYFQGPRIIMRQVLGHKLNCTVIKEDYIIDQSVFIAKPNPEFSKFIYGILGILASRLISEYFRYTSNEFDALFPKIKIGEFRELPVHKELQKSNDVLSEKVKTIISQKKADIKTSELENEVDFIVYKLYHLTYEEACKVEGNEDWMTKEAYEKFAIS